MIVKKVLVLSNNAVLGGASRSLGLMIEHLTKMNVQVIVLAPVGRAWKTWESKGAEVRLWSPPTCSWLVKPVFASYSGEYSVDRMIFMMSDILSLPYRLFRAGRLLLSIISVEKVEVIFVNTLALFCLSRIIFKMRQDQQIKVFWQIREVLNPKLPLSLFNGIARNLALASSKMIAISATEARAFSSFGPVEILHNPIPLEWPDDPHQRQIRKPARVAMSGAYRPSKGIDDYFAMVEIVRREYPDTLFFLYTPHPLPLNYRKYIRSIRALLFGFSEKLFLALDLTENMTKVVYRDAIEIIFDHDLEWTDFMEMDIYVRSDRSGSPWGRDIIEAMWAGLPIVATGSNQEFIVNGKNGFLVESGHPEALARSVIQLLGDENLHRRMASSSAERARELFDKHQYHERLSSFFHA